MSRRPLRHALVAGGSLAGLFAARVLSDVFERVTVVERDAFAFGPDARKGVPQGRHVHALLARGREILEGLFPGICEELCADGAVLLNGTRDIAWHYAGDWRVRYDGDLPILCMSRPLLEAAVAKRVRALRNVSLLEGVRLDGLIDSGAGAVTGIRVTDPGGERRGIATDLVVDATGRGSALPEWLTDLGYERPPEEWLQARVGYASCVFRQPDRRPDWGALLVTGPCARRSGMIFPIEGGRWLSTLNSRFDEPSPRDHDGFLAFARSLAAPHLHEALRGAEPLSGVASYRFAGSLRRRYERLARLPDGVIAIGDAACSFNPMFGQGMTVSAIEAERLAAALAGAKRDGGLAPDFGPRWFRAIETAIDGAWNAVAIEDLRFPELADRRPARVRPLQWYMSQVHRATHRSAAVTDQFYRVMNVLDPPTALFRSRILADVLLGGLRGSSGQAHGGAGRSVLSHASGLPRWLGPPRRLPSGSGGMSTFTGWDARRQVLLDALATGLAATAVFPIPLPAQAAEGLGPFSGSRPDDPEAALLPQRTQPMTEACTTEPWRTVYDFWFPPGLQEADLDAHARMALWWMRGGATPELPPFAPTLEAAKAGRLDAWCATPLGRLSLIVVLDQFPRGLHAGTPEAYACDPQALRIAEEGLRNGHYDALATPWERMFMVLPLVHAEGPDHLERVERVVAMAEAVALSAPERLKPLYHFSASQARGHRDVIARFGRFPHRNPILGRASTPEEEAYIAKGDFVHTRQPPAFSSPLPGARSPGKVGAA